MLAAIKNAKKNKIKPEDDTTEGTDGAATSNPDASDREAASILAKKAETPKDNTEPQPP